MAFKLALENYTAGLESQAAQVLATMKHIATLTPPITVADIRTDLETGQFQAFSNDGWDAFIRSIANVTFDDATLTVAERAIINTLREYVAPPPKTGCCEIGGNVTPSSGDGLYAFSDFYRTGSTAPYQYQFRCTLDQTYRCDIDTLEVTFTPTGGAPAVTSASPSILTSNGCDANQDRLMDYIWLEFGSSPTGQSYNLSLFWKDANGTTITSFSPAAAYTFIT